MIICPKCLAENAEEANHCGSCGGLLNSGSGQKTMFGIGAITQETLQKAADDAKAASAAAKPALGGLPKPSIPSPSGGLPKPGIPAPSAGLGAPGGFGGVPKPNIAAGLAPPSEVTGPDAAKTEMLASVPGDGDSPTNAGIQQNFGAPEPDPFAATAANNFGESAAAFADTAAPGESQLRTPGSSDAVGSAGFGATASSDFGDPPVPNSSLHAPETQPELDVPAGVAQTATPAAFNASMPQSAPNNPMQPTDGGGFGGGFGGGSGGGNFVRGEVRNPIVVLALAMFTCGFYAIYWAFMFFKDLNGGLGEERFNMLKEFGLTIVTCGFWGIWLWWRASEAIVEVQEKWGVQPMMDAPIIFVVMLLGFGPFVMQAGLNNAWENGNPPA